jgi:hypothetical protein
MTLEVTLWLRFNMVGPTYVETDTLLMKERERELKLHRERIQCTKKTIDNSRPFSLSQGKPKANKLKHFQNFERDLGNKVLLNKLLGIMNKDTSHASLTTMRNYSVPIKPGANSRFRQKEEFKRIDTENRSIVKRLTNQESELSCRNFEKHYQNHIEHSKRISRMNRIFMKQSKKTILPPINSKQRSPDRSEAHTLPTSSEKTDLDHS